MRRIWRRGAAELFTGYLILEVVLFGYRLGGGGGRSQLGELALWYCLDVLLLWRAWRGIATAWTILLILDGISGMLLLAGLTPPWSGYAIGLLVLVLAQYVLLVSPAVRRHVHAARRA